MKVILPIIVLAIAVGISVFIIKMKPEPVRQAAEPVVAKVAVVEPERTPVKLSVYSQGTVQAQTRTTLTAEVAGRIIAVSPNFRPGGFFKKGEVLVEIDPADYEANLAMEQANLAQAELTLAQEVAQAEQAAIDWEQLGNGEPTALALRKPQIRQAEAALASAAARVAKAERDLERTRVFAPYNGRVLEQSVDVGGFVSGGPTSPVGSIYSTDVAEVRLPVSDDELARLDLPFEYVGDEAIEGPPVLLTAKTGPREWRWLGRIVRTEASIDERSRLTFLVAEVKNPYVRDPDFPNRPPLKVGMFVQARIEGIPMEEAVVIPRYALRENQTVLVATPGDTLARRSVTVAQSDDETAILTEGLEAGDRIIVSPMEYPIEGMGLVVEGPESAVQGQESGVKSQEPNSQPQ